MKDMRDEYHRKVIRPVVPKELLDEEFIKYYINPTGRFVCGRPMGDTGTYRQEDHVDATAAWEATAEGHSPARTQRRSIVPALTSHAILRRTLLQPVLPTR